MLKAFLFMFYTFLTLKVLFSIGLISGDLAKNAHVYVNEFNIIFDENVGFCPTRITTKVTSNSTYLSFIYSVIYFILIETHYEEKLQFLCLVT